MTVWIIEDSDLFKRKLKQYEKKHRRETIAALTNLDTYVRLLNDSFKPAQIEAGFIHHEPQGVKAVDQKGAGNKPRQTRLYFYPCEQDHTVYLITIGDKNSQKNDVRDSREFVNKLRADIDNG